MEEVGEEVSGVAILIRFKPFHQFFSIAGIDTLQFQIFHIRMPEGATGIDLNKDPVEDGLLASDVGIYMVVVIDR